VKCCAGMMVPFKTVIFLTVSTVGNAITVPLTGTVVVVSPWALSVTVPVRFPDGADGPRRTYTVSYTTRLTGGKVILLLKPDDLDIDTRKPGEAATVKLLSEFAAKTVKYSWFADSAPSHALICPFTKPVLIVWANPFCTKKKKINKKHRSFKTVFIMRTENSRQYK